MSKLMRWPLRKIGPVTAAALLALLTVGVAFAQSGQPAGITKEARQMHDLYILVLVMALVVFVPLAAALVFMLIRFRKRDEELPPQIHGNNKLEVLWTVIPIVIVLILFGFSLKVLLDVENDAKPEDLTVDVQGFQFQWQFTYRLDDLGTNSQPDSKDQVVLIGTPKDIPTLVIPVNEPVEFRLRSNDVIHSFYIRDFLYKLDVIPGRNNSFIVTAEETGMFTGQCAELCGIDHALMRFKVQVVTRAEFDAWVAAAPKTPVAAVAAVGGD